MHGTAELLDRQLREGDGLAWSGDPRLWLGVGVLTAPRRMQHPTTRRWLNRGDVVARRYEVWRHNEDGTDTKIGSWLIGEFDRILFDLQQMRAGAEGRIEDVTVRIDKHNDALDKANSAKVRDAAGAMHEHALLLGHDRGNPRHTFRGMPGMNPTKQA
jgi:hypothetical protein